MNYKELLKQLAIKENISVHEVENEMRTALYYAGLNCSPKEFIETTAKLVQKTIYSR